jgi:fatty acid desaturase
MQGITAHEAARLPSVEWPTVALIAACYCGWLLLTSRYGIWPLWVVAPATAVLLTLHGSLQHEILHGHPTRWYGVNYLLGLVPLSLWIPYDRYRTTHLIHHINDRLTDPVDDPESNYWTPGDWDRLPAWRRKLVMLQTTLAGRVLIGPWWSIGRYIARDLRLFVKGEPGVRSAWIVHLAACVPVVYWVTAVCGIPFWLYVVAMVLPGKAILLIRSFAEHRAGHDWHERTAIVEGSRLLGPLFLFNNLHSLHHEEPLMPWYRYNRRYRVVRDKLVAENGGLVYRTYFDVARRFLFKPHDKPVHPTGRVPPRTGA